MLTEKAFESDLQRLKNPKRRHLLLSLPALVPPFRSVEKRVYRLPFCRLCVSVCAPEVVIVIVIVIWSGREAG